MHDFRIFIPCVIHNVSASLRNTLVSINSLHPGEFFTLFFVVLIPFSKSLDSDQVCQIMIPLDGFFIDYLKD